MKEVVGRKPFSFQHIGRQWRLCFWSEDQLKMNLPASPQGGRKDQDCGGQMHDREMQLIFEIG